MRTKYSIGIFILAFILIYLSLSIADTGSFENKEHNTTLSTDEQVFDSSGYYLQEVNGYVVVYLNDRKTVYDYTNILYSELPYILQEEIKNGKYIKNVDELYGFLENYTS